MLAAATAAAAPDLPDYRDTLGARLAAPVVELNRAGQYRAAIRRAGRLNRAVGRLAVVSYEAGYAHYQLGELEVAVSHYDAALRRDPDKAEALYDRGEIRLLQGDLDRAVTDFTAVVRLRPDHWGGHFRLAHAAALSDDAALFERHLMEAIHHGFNLEVVIGDPTWSGFVQSTTLRPVLRKVVVLYGSPRLKEWVGVQP